MTGGGAEIIIIMMTDGGRRTSEVEIRTGEDPAATGRTGAETGTTMRGERLPVDDTLPRPMAEDTEDPGADQQSVFFKTTCNIDVNYTLIELYLMPLCAKNIFS